MEPSHPFLLPRSVPCSAGVMYHKCKHNINQDLETDPSGYAVVSANVDRILTVCSSKSSGVPLDTNFLFPEQNERVHLNTPPHRLATTVGGSIVVAGQLISPTLQDLVGYSALQSDGTFVEDKVWVWDIDIAANTILTFSGHTEEQYLGGQQVAFKSYPSGGNVQTANWAQTDNEVKAAIPLGVGTLSGKYFISVFLCDGFEGGTYNFTAGKVTTKAAPNIRVYSLWELLGNVHGSEISQQQFAAAAKYSITGLSSLIQNTSAAQYKSGSIVCAQLPGGTFVDLPADPLEMYEMIGSFNDPKTYSGQLNQGAHWFFAPEKIQDWFFRPVTDTDGDRPYFVAAWNGVAVNEMANKLGLTIQLRINIELLTSDISLMKFLPTADLSRLMDLYVTMVAAHNTVSENPNHMAKIRKIISSVMKSPYTRDALISMAKAGTKLIPLALAAL